MKDTLRFLAGIVVAAVALYLVVVPVAILLIKYANWVSKWVS